MTAAVEARDPFVAVDQRAVQQLDPLSLSLGKPVEMKTLTGDSERAVGHVESTICSQLRVLHRF